MVWFDARYKGMDGSMLGGNDFCGGPKLNIGQKLIWREQKKNNYTGTKYWHPDKN